VTPVTSTPEISVEPLSETAARHLVRHVPTAGPGDRVGVVIAGLRQDRFDSIDAVYVVDGTGRLLGFVPLGELVTADDELAVEVLLRPRVPMARADTDQEHVARLAREYGLPSVPVVDDEGRLLGVVPSGAIIDVLRREHVEDIHRMAGIVHGDGRGRDVMTESLVLRLRHRLPWLVVGLAGSVVATAIVAGFEETLSERVAVAYFIPAIVYLADAIGTQSEAIAVRGLSLEVAPLRRLLPGELAAGLLIGLVLGSLAFLGVLVVFDARLGFAVGTAILVAGGIASTIGLILPWVLARAGADPAYGSGPVATIIQDVMSLLTYFAVAQLLLV
jgi:magnesium transporter